MVNQLLQKRQHETKDAVGRTARAQKPRDAAARVLSPRGDDGGSDERAADGGGDDDRAARLAALREREVSAEADAKRLTDERVSLNARGRATSPGSDRMGPQEVPGNFWTTPYSYLECHGRRRKLRRKWKKLGQVPENHVLPRPIQHFSVKRRLGPNIFLACGALQGVSPRGPY